MGNIECSGCNRIQECQDTRPYYYHRDGDTEVSSSELAKSWVDSGCSANFWDRIVDGLNPIYYAEMVTQTISVEAPTQFDGTEEEALAAGWTEGEFGWVCPICQVNADLGTAATGSVEDMFHDFLSSK